MWTARRESIAGMTGETIAIAASGHAMTAGDVIAGWRDDAAFRDFFIAELAVDGLSGILLGDAAADAPHALRPV